DAVFESVVYALAVVDEVEAGKAVGRKHVRLVKLEIEAVLVGYQRRVSVVQGGGCGKNRLEHLTYPRAAAHEGGAPLETDLGKDASGKAVLRRSGRGRIVGTGLHAVDIVAVHADRRGQFVDVARRGRVGQYPADLGADALAVGALDAVEGHEARIDSP